MREVYASTVVASTHSLDSRNSLEVQFNLSIDHAPQTFDKADWFVVRFALPLDFFECCARRNGESRLMDYLISGIQFGNDEMSRGSKRQHMVSICIGVRPETWKRGQQAVMQIDDSSTCKLPACSR